jgi:4,5:9,10-diseco-3-hydroxy-5,9,17-trioxoandrosta-1(10),2-diene-4-oate hydrolase
MRETLSHVVEGSGPPLLLIHGWGATIVVWRCLLPFLTPHFQVIMVELPGFGRSPAADASSSYYQVCVEEIERLRRRLGIDRWALLGYSIGARVGELYTLYHTEHVSRAVFICAGYLQAHARRELGLALSIDRRLPAILPWLFSGWRKPALLWTALVLTSGLNRRNREAMAIIAPANAAQPAEALIRSARDLADLPAARIELPSAPSLYIWGRNDPLMAIPRPRRANDVVIAANHMAPLTAAPAIAQAALPFLAGDAQAQEAEPRPAVERSV